VTLLHSMAERGGSAASRHFLHQRRPRHRGDGRAGLSGLPAERAPRLQPSTGSAFRSGRPSRRVRGSGAPRSSRRPPPSRRDRRPSRPSGDRSRDTSRGASPSAGRP
jgi:hypothetical protein